MLNVNRSHQIKDNRMTTKKLPQELYDNLCLRLEKNGNALNDVAFSTVKRKLESSARTELDGVEVSTAYLKFAVEMLANNVAVNGGKYASTLDKLVLFEIDEILNATGADIAPINENSSTEDHPRPAKRKINLSELNRRF